MYMCVCPAAAHGAAGRRHQAVRESFETEVGGHGIVATTPSNGIAVSPPSTHYTPSLSTHFARDMERGRGARDLCQ